MKTLRPYFKLGSLSFFTALIRAGLIGTFNPGEEAAAAAPAAEVPTFQLRVRVVTSGGLPGMPGPYSFGFGARDRYNDPCRILGLATGIEEKPRERMLIANLSRLKDAGSGGSTRWKRS